MSRSDLANIFLFVIGWSGGKSWAEIRIRYGGAIRGSSVAWTAAQKRTPWTSLEPAIRKFIRRMVVLCGWPVDVEFLPVYLRDACSCGDTFTLHLETFTVCIALIHAAHYRRTVQYGCTGYRISGPGPDRNTAVFSYPAPAGFGRRI